jgi:hypothetical protein
MTWGDIAFKGASSADAFGLIKQAITKQLLLPSKIFVMAVITQFLIP